jgi:hypothetical protein
MCFAAAFVARAAGGRFRLLLRAGLRYFGMT